MNAKAVFFLDENETYNGPEPYFYDSSSVPGAKILEANWHIIRDEFAAAIAGTEAGTADIPYPPYLSRPRSWKIIYFYNFMWKYNKNCRVYPKTYALLNTIPDLTFAAVTVLEPHASVLPHIGETNTTMRGHLGLYIPAPYPVAGLKVGTEEKGWEEGKAILFSDSHWHTAWNNADQARVVLIFDIMRPEFAARRRWMCALGLSSIMIKMANQRWALFKPLPQVVSRIVHRAIAAVWWLYLPFQRRLGLP